MAIRKWTIARRGVQLAVIALIGSPLAGLSFFQGNLSAASLFSVALADPLAFLQASLAGRVFVASFLGSALLVALFYFLLGGRTFCGWVCPVYLLTELADKIRARLGSGKRTMSLSGTRWSFVVVLLISPVAGIPLFEVVSPIGVVTRAVMFGAWLPLLLIGAILVVEVVIARRVWCRSLCPVGGFYSLLGRFSPVRVSFIESKCTNCGECTQACPVEEVLVPSLEHHAGQIVSGDCTRCGACIDVCAPGALRTVIGYKSVSS